MKDNCVGYLLPISIDTELAVKVDHVNTVLSRARTAFPSQYPYIDTLVATGVTTALRISA